MRKPLVAIAGRPNVGKSTLFNRLLGEPSAIVEDVHGITRDRHYATATWNGHPVMLVDTGGIISEPTDEIPAEVRKQALIAVEEADLVLFVVNGQEPLTFTDRDILDELRRSGKKMLLVVNKVDGPRHEENISEFLYLGTGEPFMISALHGRGVSELREQITELLPKVPGDLEEEEFPKVAVVGKPNAGKSTFVNALLGKERLIVSAVAGTTRDSIDTMCRYHGRPYLLIDTAGLRKKSRIDQPVEYFSMVRTIRSIDRSEIVLILMDASTGFTEQDQKILGMVHEAGKSAIILVNKWDLTERTDAYLQKVTNEIRTSAWFMPHIPILSISALNRQRITRVFPLIDSVLAEYRKRISTAALNAFIDKIKREASPPRVGGRGVSLLYVTQVRTAPPGFAVFSNRPRGLTPAYLRFLERRLREEFGFTGTPIRLFVKPRSREEGTTVGQRKQKGKRSGPPSPRGR